MTQSTRARAAADTLQPRIDPTTVNGWGVDADIENDPTWPMRDRSKDDGPGLNWDRPPLQTSDVEILQSVEHERRTATYGVSTPPRGLSGAIRRRAFAFSESQWGHWLLLMAADRVDAVEGLIEDVRRGRMPNPLVEMGLVKQARSREAAAATAAAVGIGLMAVIWLLRRDRD
ncbi:MAG: hypothetical protein ACK4JY_00900 [Brevundimonas sp.]|uniref:hypothetical protein n=1 Tax=Brevundimonas sp. TaxID=1871086 RepID=UPI00391B4BDE